MTYEDWRNWVKSGDYDDMSGFWKEDEEAEEQEALDAYDMEQESIAEYYRTLEEEKMLANAKA